MCRDRSGCRREVTEMERSPLKKMLREAEGKCCCRYSWCGCWGRQHCSCQSNIRLPPSWEESGWRRGVLRGNCRNVRDSGIGGVQNGLASLVVAAILVTTQGSQSVCRLEATNGKRGGVKGSVALAKDKREIENQVPVLGLDSVAG